MSKKSLNKVGVYRPFYISVLIVFLLVACNSEKEEKSLLYDYYPSKTHIKYAQGFNVSYFKSYKVVEVYEDLDNSTIVQRYFLVEQGTRIPEMNKEDQLIRIPLASTSCLSTTQVAYLSELNMIDKISGVGYASSVRDSLLSEQIEKGWTMEITRSGQLDLELVLQANTSLLMANTFDKLSVSSLKEMGIPVIFTSEYLENNVLARAEWLKFFALFFNAEERASVLFKKIEEDYLATKSKLDKLSDKPVVMFGSYYQDSWYVPGGKSLISSLFNDAGASYLFKNDASRSNIQVDIEVLLDKMNQIDLWGLVLASDNQLSISDFLGDSNRMIELAEKEDLKFFYANSKESDYFGKAIIEPQVILKDLGKIFHPKLFTEHQFVYFQSHN